MAFMAFNTEPNQVLSMVLKLQGNVEHIKACGKSAQNFANEKQNNVWLF